MYLRVSEIELKLIVDGSKSLCMCIIRKNLLVRADEAASRDEEDENAEDDDGPTEEIDALVVGP